MKKYLIFLFCQFLFGCFVESHAKEDKKSKEKDFIQTFKQFKYSLYPELAKLTKGDIRGYNYPKEIITKIDLFFEDNTVLISQTQKSMLKECEDVEMDYTTFKEDSLYSDLKNKDILGILLGLDDGNGKGYSILTIFKLMLNPIEKMNTVLNVISVQKLGTLSMDSYADRVMINYIGGILIKTKPLQNDSWLLVYNNYFNIFEFNFNLKTQQIIFLNGYKRIN